MKKDLKTQFLNHMTLQRFSHHTKDNYMRGIEGLAQFHQQDPDTLTNDQIQEYLRHLLEDRKLSWGTCNNYFSGIISFYHNVCKWDETRFQLPPRPRIKKLPMILSVEEVKRLLASANNLKHRVLLSTIYSAGLRVSEVVRLKPDHIESDPSRMMIRVEQGKGKKDRYTILSKKLLVELRTYWGKYNPGTWLFPGNKTDMHLCRGAAQRAFSLAKKKPA
jgi:site-specific recombinase XerD